MTGPEKVPTRSAVLELKNELAVVEEAYDFLDEKRLLLAAELLKQLELYERMLTELELLAQQANKHLAAAVERHGLQGISVYPGSTLDGMKLGIDKHNYMGVTLVENHLDIPEHDRGTQVIASNPSMEAEECRSVFREILQQSAVLAGISGNLHRLLTEYRLTERRARALENVIMPEIEQALNGITTHLEEVDLEEAIRVRLQVPD